MLTRTLYCKIGKHKWEADVKRGKPPANCPDHRPKKAEVDTGEIQTLFCAKGQHDWERPYKRGRRPQNCPDHPEKETQKLAPNTSERIRNIIEKSLIEHPNPRCTCDFEGIETWAQLRKMDGCQPRWICSTLDRIRRICYNQRLDEQ